MVKISLINMPFSNLALPSIALTQLKSIVENKFQDKVSVEIVYLSHDIAKYLGLELYYYLTNSMEALNTGLGDWFFRQVAFPDIPDNTEEYLGRYFPVKSVELQRLKRWIAEKRPSLDAHLDELISRYKLDEVQIAGLTSMFSQNAASFAMARKLKVRNPGVITLLGGANCEYPMGGVIAKCVPSIDFVFSGPALESFCEFIQQHLDGTMEKCGAIRGVFSKGAPLPQGPSTLGEDLNIDTPLDLDYEAFVTRVENEFPKGEIQPILPFETSRGCWWGERAHCTFCGLNGTTMAYRAMKPDLALELFNSLFRYSGRVTRLTGVDNILPKSYLKDVLPALDTPSDMEIFYEVKADLSEEDVAILSRSRVLQVQPGIESLATSTLKLMKKGTTVFQNLRLLKWCAMYGVTPNWNLLIGFPGEGEDVYKRYVEFLPQLVHLCPPSGAYPVRFDRFSPYYDLAETYKLDLSPLDFYHLVYPFSPEDIKNFAYYFADRNLKADYFTVMARWIGKIRARIVQWQSRWNNVKQIPPRLHFKQNSNLVYDSRSGQVIEHAIGENGKAVLDYLSKPAQIDDLPKKLGPETGIDVLKEVAHLQAKGLIFQEGTRLLSLVMDDDHGSKKGQFVHSQFPIQHPPQQVLVQLN